MNFLEKQKRAKELIGEYLSKYSKNCVAVSFGKDSVVLLHLVKEISAKIPVIAVLSDTEFDETYAYRDFLVKEWNLKYTEHQFKNDPQKGLEDCCRNNKVETFKEALKEYDCWFSGIRKDEGFTRQNFEEVENFEEDVLFPLFNILLENWEERNKKPENLRSKKCGYTGRAYCLQSRWHTRA